MRARLLAFFALGLGSALVVSGQALWLWPRACPIAGLPLTSRDQTALMFPIISRLVTRLRYIALKGKFQVVSLPAGFDEQFDLFHDICIRMKKNR
jgi:hypothetical protein